MNIIFLDIDGVLNTINYGVQAHGMWKKTNGWFKSKDEFGAIFDPFAVDFLIYLTETTKSKIVISSTWRKAGLERMKAMFKFRGIPVDVVDVTPILNTKRGEEIETWLQMNDYVTNYVILDDDTDFTDYQLNDYVTNYVILDDDTDFTDYQLNHKFVLTRGKCGFDHNCLVKALKILMERC